MVVSDGEHEGDVDAVAKPMSRRPLDRERVGPIAGYVRIDRRTKRLVKRLQPGEIAVIDHEDLDRIAAETLIEASAGAVINASDSITGRYPNLGPLLVAAAGIPLIDGVGPEVLERLSEGDVVTVDDDTIYLDGEKVATGTRQTMASLEAEVARARKRMGIELERFAQNTLEYLRKEGRLLTEVPEVPDIGVDFKNRHVLIVVRGVDYREDLQLLRRTGYLQEMKPLLIGVDGGADALLELGCKPDVIIGDFDSVSERSLHCGAKLVVHAYADGRAPGAARLDELGLTYTTFESPGTSEDIAMLLAYENDAELLVAVGTHNSMVEFLDKGRAGMASTFLVRMKVGPILVDAKGVSRLYETRVRKRDLLMMVGAAMCVLIVITVVSEPIRLFLRTLWVSLT